MNEKELRNVIETSIKTEKLSGYLLDCLKNECELNSLNLPLSIIQNASQRFEAKIKACQQLEKDLSDDLILPGEYRLLSEKLDTLRLKLAIVYADGTNIEITKANYNEIKVLISNILGFNEIKLKFKYFDLVLKFLEKAIVDSQFNKEFIGALDLLKLFVNERNYLPNDTDLKYISDLGRQTNEDEIRKCFYGIIRELDKKLLFQDLLNQLLKIIKNINSYPLMLFNIIFITKCLNSVISLEVDDLNQVIRLVYRALEAYTAPLIMKKSYPFTISKKIFNQKKLNKYLIEFAKDFKEKTLGQIINYSVWQDLSITDKSALDKNIQEFDFMLYFPTHINNEKIRAKFSEAKLEYNETFKKNITTNDSFVRTYFRKSIVNVISKSNRFIEKVKTLASDVKENLEEFAETSSNRLSSLIRKNSETLNFQEYEETDEIEMNNPITQAKARLSSIKEKLNLWNSILNYPIEPHVNQQNQIDTSQINVNNCSEFIVDFYESINEKYSLLNQQIIEKFEEINDTIKKQGYWLEKPEVNKPSWFYKILHRGYFNIDFSVKKIKTKFGDAPSFEEINNFFSKKSFWTLLLNYGIVRWPWINKAVFAYNWAKQLCLPDIITQTEELKNTLLDTDNELLKKIITLSQVFFPYKESEAIIHVLDDFKKYITVQLRQLETLEQDIANDLNEKEVSLFSSSSKLLQFFESDKNPGFSSPEDLISKPALGSTLKVH